MKGKSALKILRNERKFCVFLSFLFLGPKVENILLGKIPLLFVMKLDYCFCCYFHGLLTGEVGTTVFDGFSRLTEFEKLLWVDGNTHAR